MRTFIFLVVYLSALTATLAAQDQASQDLVMYVSPTAASDGSPLGPGFSFVPTAVGSSASQSMRLKNTSAANSYQILSISFDPSAPFTITGTNSECLGPGASEDFTAMFAPVAAGNASDTITVTYTPGCAGVTTESSVWASTAFTGVGSSSAGPAQDLVISVMTPATASDTWPLGPTFSFPDTALGDSSSAVFRMVNTSSVNTYQVAFIDFAGAVSFKVSGTVEAKCLAPGGNEDFTVTFTPVAVGSATNPMRISYAQFGSGSGCSATGGVVSLVNWATFSGQGVPAVIGGGGSGGGSQTGELSLTYIGTNGAINTLTSGSTFDFGRIPENQTLTQVMTLSNRASLPVTVSAVSISGAAFSIVGAVPSPLVIAAGQSYSFTVQFAPTNPTPFTGTLSIGVQSITLTGIGYAPPFPNVSLAFNVATLGNQQQDQVEVNLSAAAPYASTGTLTMAFTPSSSASAVDDALVFAATGGTNLTISFAEGAQAGTYNDVSAFTFQTGTTAGTLTFTFTMEGISPVTQTFTLSPSVVQISTGNGQWLAPSLVVNLTGYDNSYSAGNMVFTFYDSNGNVLTQGAVTLNAAQTFQQYFTSETGNGGAFALQANFPVTGYAVGPSCLGIASPPANCQPASAVDVTIQNSVGVSQKQHIVFQ